nr:basic proline-rich protein-like [Peromyscus maniculatus bairdii]
MPPIANSVTSPPPPHPAAKSRFFQPLSKADLLPSPLPVPDSSRPGVLLRPPSPWLALLKPSARRRPRPSAGLSPGARGLLNILSGSRPRRPDASPLAAWPPTRSLPGPPSPPARARYPPPGPRSPYPPAAGCVALPADMAAGSRPPPANYPPPPSRHFRPNALTHGPFRP